MKKIIITQRASNGTKTIIDYESVHHGMIGSESDNYHSVVFFIDGIGILGGMYQSEQQAIETVLEIIKHFEQSDEPLP